MGGRPSKPEEGEDAPPPKEEIEAAPFKKMWRYATWYETMGLMFALLCAVIGGGLFPMFTLVFGALLDAFNDPNGAQVDVISTFSIYFLYIAAGSFVLSVIEAAVPIMVAEACVRRVRINYVRSLLRQDPGWFDVHRGGEAVIALAECSTSMVGGMTDKVTLLIRGVCTMLAGFSIGFYTSWKLTLVIAASAPFFAIALGILIGSSIKGEKALSMAYARAGDAATEAISTIRSVAAFGGERHEADRYDGHINDAMVIGIKKGFGLGASVGTMLLTFYGMYGVSTWAGAKFIAENRMEFPNCTWDPTGEECFTGGKVVQCFIAVLLGAQSIGQLGPLIGDISAARAAAGRLYKVIDNTPEIDSEGEGGEVPAPTGRLEFNNVSFSYPSRPDIPILKNFSLVVEPGQTLALVGESGCGKSTLIQLLQRNYDPSEGSVKVDGVDVKAWNLQALRSRMGLVQQDPLLFACSIMDNIKLGAAPGTVTDADAVQAAKSANAHDFIAALREGYATDAGTSVAATQLSGGQRQRICIARAIVRKPGILLLDEATSALDTQSERIVQASLDELLVRAQSTKVVIAHRLSTVVNSDVIVVMSKGSIIEQGSHGALMSIENGNYRAMYELQALSGVEQGGADDAVGDSKEVKLEDKKAGDQDDEGTGTADAIADEEENFPKVSRRRLWSLQKDSKGILALGVIGSIASGCIQPVFAVIYGDMIALFFEPDVLRMEQESFRFLGLFFMMGFAAWLAVLGRISVFTYLGEQLTRTLRSQTYRAILRQPIEFFDKRENSVGRLSARLANDAALVKNANGESLGTIIEGGSAVVCAIVISFQASWQLALVMLGVFPFLIMGGLLEFNSYGDTSLADTKAQQLSSQSVLEAVIGIKTVTAFGLQAATVTEYTSKLTSSRLAVKKAMIKGMGDGFQKFILLASYALAFYAGARFLESGVITDFNQILRVFLAVTLSAEAVGRVSSQAPDAAKAQRAANAIFHLLDSVQAGTAIDPMQEGGTPVANVQGKIEFKNVRFAYPGRPEATVLDGFSLTIQPGQKVALVGASGSGKSTVIQLLQRFYDPASGEILLDDQRLTELNVPGMRSCMSLVQQEPVLFADSIAYNIEYGRKGHVKGRAGMGAVPEDEAAKKAEAAAALKKKTKKNKGKKGAEESSVPLVEVRPVTPASDVTAASQKANCYTFITDFQHKFATYCGSRGTQLSGGQKQRIAIARALIREPQILLLDEATSALDNQSEAVVQAALDAAASEGAIKRTCVIIAHRLSSIAGSDLIVVMDSGKVVETGTHAELMAAKGGYWRLANAQGATEAKP